MDLMAIYLLSKCRHLVFFKCEFLTSHGVKRVNMRHLSQISWRSVNPLLKHGDLLTFSKWHRQPSLICYTRIGTTSQTVAESWRFNGFKMAAVRHVGFLKIQLLTAGVSITVHNLAEIHAVVLTICKC